MNVTATGMGVSDKVMTKTIVSLVRPDLIVTEITPNCGYLFANETNEICAVIKNNGTADAGAFNVSFSAFLDGLLIDKVCVEEGLAVGETIEVCVNDTAEYPAGLTVPIGVFADCDDEISELNETNNENSTEETVVNNGYKGKRYTGGEDITTLQTHTLNGSVLYSVGDSKYLSGATAWTNYTANWSASDPPVPETATVVVARLYVIYTWDMVQGMPDNVGLKFNDDTVTRDAFYTDRKGYGRNDYPYGMLAYNVTGDFNMSENTAILTNLNPVGGNPSMRGMLLVVVYADESEPMRKIIVNEGFDLLYGGSAQCTTAEEATAFAPFEEAIEDVANKSARLITVAPGAGRPNEGELIFNGHVWTDVWNFAGATEIGIDDRYVTAYLNATTNEAGFQSSEDWMEASNAILVVEEKPFIEEYNFTIDFVTDYNMISVPLNDTSVVNASSLAMKVGANCTEIVKWDSATQAYVSYIPGVPLNDFNTAGGEGYLVNVVYLTEVTFEGEPWHE